MAAGREDKTLSWLPIGGAAVIALLAVVLIISVGSSKDKRLGLRTDDDGALSCPATYKMAAVQDVSRVPRGWVPIIPSGVDGDDHLIPDSKPQHVTICRYPGAGASLSTASQIRLGGRTVVRTNTSGMTKAFSKAVKSSGPTSGACSGPGTIYLIGVVFPTGVEWVSLPGTVCQRTTNGVFDTTTDLSQQVASAFDSGSWG